ncbi:hypothetical protein EI94DRAFT_1720542, partial [Lactarius quietus]
MPSISPVRRTVGFDSSDFCDPFPSCFFTEMSASSPGTITPVASANSTQIESSIIDYLLADTPPFALGLLGFAVFTFFLILKKMNLASLYLLSSVLLMFFGALTDLGQLYLQHAYSTESPSPSAAPSLTIIREVLYSIASGLRFLFYWVFVSQPPLCEQDSARFLSVHSGSWQRWGVTGSLLRWTTLAASFLVFVLQVLWRTVSLMHEFGPVYDIEGAVEITTTAIFIVKLLLNVSLVEESTRRQTLWQYSSVLFALSLNMVIGIGNLMHFAFSEITLGRLLLAAEFQILVVSTMVFAFYSTKTVEASTSLAYSKRASSFRGLHLSFYDPGPGLLNPSRTSRIQSRPPSAQSVSSWLGRNVRSRPPSHFGPLGAEKSERGLSGYPSEKEILAFASDMVPDSAQSSARWDGPVYPSSVVNSFVGFPLPPGSEGPSSPLSGQFPLGFTSNAREASSSSVPRVAAMVPDSPVLGSDDVSFARKSTPLSPRLQPLSNASFASSGASDYETLFREQIELERSIAALRSAHDLPERGTARESSTTGNGHASVSGRSEFSLSIFPEPPRLRPFEEDYRQSSSSSVLLPPRLSIFTAGRGFPTSDRGSEDGVTLGIGVRALSGGTHYDVTSFIGDLSSPDENLPHTPTQPWMSDTDSEPGSAVQATIVTVERKTSLMVSPPPAIYTWGATTSRTPSTKRVVGLPSRPNPSANRRIGDVVDSLCL